METNKSWAQTAANSRKNYKHKFFSLVLITLKARNILIEISYSVAIVFRAQSESSQQLGTFNKSIFRHESCHSAAMASREKVLIVFLFCLLGRKVFN